MNRSDNPPVDYDLTCWYLNARRVMELVGAESILPYLQNAPGIAGVKDNVRASAIIATLKRDLMNWLEAKKPPTLGQIIKDAGLKDGQFFTHYTAYYFRGLSEVSKALRENKPTKMAFGHAKIDELIPGKKLTFHFHHDHLTSNSSWAHLTGQKRMMLFGIIQEVKPDEIVALPYVLAYTTPSIFDAKTYIGSHWYNRLEVFVDEIENFGELKEYRPDYKKSDLKLLENISEADVKAAIADLIGEPTVPKDWGGENSDLFSRNVRIDGERRATAFVFKGPAKFHPMTLADLGKNGDQINRLFTEPAELLVLQHCHEITPAVIGMMRAFSQQFGNLRTYCVINGYDTLRILEFNKKCGLAPRTLT